MKANPKAPCWLPLSYLADVRTLGFVTLLTALLVVQWASLWRGWWLLPATYLLALVAAVIKHNHMHCATFYNRRWNFAFELWLSIVTGQPSTGIITVHNELHHGHNNKEVDFVRCSLVRFRWNWLNLLVFPFLSVFAMYRGKPSDLEKWRRQRRSLYHQALVERGLTYAVIVVLMVLDWQSTVKYCLGPWLFAQWAIIGINLLQHQDCDVDSEFDHSRNLTGGPLNWVLLNNGYHTAHHMFPGAHWSTLPAIHRELIAFRVRPGLDEQSLLSCLWRRFLVAQDWGGSTA